jgi:ubiquinone/menaquinone biosynthesis C-methylase UbiE
MITKTIKKFWNSKGVVSEFKDAQVREYWVRYFSSIKSKNRKSVLDLGCGGGRYTEMLAKMGFKVFALDLHKGMINETTNRIKKLRDLKFTPVIVKAEMANIPFIENKFDIILSNGVFHNAKSFNNLKKALDETSRVIKKDGNLCLNVFYDGGSNSLIKKTGEKYLFRTKDNLPMTLLPLEELVFLLKKSGFRSTHGMALYTRDMEVGTRDVMRGVFKKI